MAKVVDMSPANVDKPHPEIPDYIHSRISRKGSAESSKEHSYIASLVNIFLSMVYFGFSIAYLSSYKSSFSQQSLEYGDAVFNTPVFWCLVRDLFCLVGAYFLLMFVLRKLLYRNMKTVD